MVVVAIIVIAAGFMTPSITEFMRNRQLENVRGNLGSTFNQARLRAVNQRAKVSLVFFREGVRVFDAKDQFFLDHDTFNPETSPLATVEGQSPEVWFELGFLGDTTSLDLPEYRQWEQANPPGRAVVDGALGPARYNVEKLPRLTFQRDGTLVFETGNDVSTTGYKKTLNPETFTEGEGPFPETDVVIKQKSNPTWCFVDFRTTGQFRANSAPTGVMPTPPRVAGEEDDEKKPKKKKRRKRRKSKRG
jgi:hypothetical protein